MLKNLDIGTEERADVEMFENHWRFKQTTTDYAFTVRLEEWLDLMKHMYKDQGDTDGHATESTTPNKML